MEIFTSSGFTEKQAAGMVGNLIHESGLKPTAKGDSGGAYGIAQWRGRRFRHLKDFAAERGTCWQDYDIQLRFVVHELESSEADACGRLRKAASTQEATKAFGRLYLRPRRMEKARYKHASRVYARLAAPQDSLRQLRP